MSYTGWHTLDVLPHRDDVIRATQESVFWLRGLHNLMDKIDRERFGVKIISDDSNEDFVIAARSHFVAIFVEQGIIHPN